MSTLVYIVKPNESVGSIAAKFGRDYRELIKANPHLPTKVIWYAGQPYTVFVDLRIGQNLIIPNSWIAVRRLGISGVGLGAAEGEKCGISNFATCDGDLQCSDYYDGICMKSSQPIQPVIGPDLQCQAQGGTWDGTKKCVFAPSAKEVCITSGGTWDDATQSCEAAPTCYQNAMGCNKDSDCCSGYCNTNIKGIPGVAGQCQIKGVQPPPLGVCKLPGVACNTDGDCCSSNCDGGKCSDQAKTPVNVIPPCDNPETIQAVQEYLVSQYGSEYPLYATTGSWGVWGPEDTFVLNQSGRTFTDIYHEITGGNVQCSGDGPAGVNCPAGQEMNPDTMLCEVPVGPGPVQPKPPSCKTGYKLSSDGKSCVPTGLNPVTEHQCADNQVWDDSQGKCVDKSPAGFPWLWVIIGGVVVVGGGTVAYYAMKDKKKTGETSSGEIPEPVAAEPYVRMMTRR